jgi:multidrug efflux pump subunit AcrA (membrane-fusion protein)
LTALESELGTWLPAGEIVFLKGMPVRVDQVAVSRGSIIEGSFITVSGSELALRSSVSERDAPRVDVGMEVEIENPETRESISGVISEKADRAGTNGVAQDRIYLEITPSELPDEIIGANVRVTIPVSSTGGAVLAVPAAALSATANGSTILQVEGEDLALTTVTVETGLAAGGLVEVTPIGGDLVAGDLVVVGREGSSTGAGEPATDTSDDA